MVTGDKVRGRVSHCTQTQLSLKAESVSPFLRWNFPLNTRCKSVGRRGLQRVITVIREQLLAVIRSSAVTPQVSAPTAACGAGGTGGGNVPAEPSSQVSSTTGRESEATFKYQVKQPV